MNHKIKSAKVQKTETQIMEKLIKEEATEIMPFALADIEKMKESSGVQINRICYPCEGTLKDFWLIYEIDQNRFTEIQYKENGKFKHIPL